MSTLDWVVVGGGPHGLCAARALQATGAQVRIVDPSGALLDRWKSRASAVAMTWMRSPVSHHLDWHPTELHHFLHGKEHADVAKLARPYLRPMHEAFLRQTRVMIDRDRLEEVVIAGRVGSLHDDGNGLVVEGEGVSLRTRRVLLATGSNQMRIPDWAQRLRHEGARVSHVFEAEAELATDILGGGISAVQRAIEVWRQTRQTVRLWVRRPIQVAEFDYDQALARARFVGRWSRQDETQRLTYLDRTSARGSVPPGLWARLSNAMRRGRVQLHVGELRVERADTSGRLRLTGTDGTVESGGLTLATGFEPEQVGGWLKSSVESLGLPVRANLPRLEDDMHWGRGVYVSGPLARLRLGPMAGNIVGARWAASLLPGVKMQPY